MEKIEYKIGDQFYCQKYGNGNYESISLVTLESINLKKIRGKDEYYNTYSFKYSDGSIESQFTNNHLSKLNTAIFSKTKNISSFHSLYFYIYKLDDEHILERKKELKNKNEKYQGIKVLEQYISELKESNNFNCLPKLNAVIEVIKNYG